jgi:tricorn protease
VESIGVPPDIEVEQVPAEMIEGHNPQLEKAIQVVLEELEKNLPRKPQRPPFKKIKTLADSRLLAFNRNLVGY